jgi:hypothetical protein
MNFLKFKQMSPYHLPGSKITGESLHGSGENRNEDASGCGEGYDPISQNGVCSGDGTSYACGHVIGAGCCNPNGHGNGRGSGDGAATIKGRG